MRMLLVEDERVSLGRFMDALHEEEFSEAVDVTFASTRQEACDLLEDAEYDFIVCDLHVPADEQDEPMLEHGIAVFECATRNLPGTPTVLITGSGDQRSARQLLAARASVDVFGVGEGYPMTDLVYKHELDECMRRVEDVVRQLEALSQIDLLYEADDPPLRPMAARALKIFARRNGARRVEVSRLGGLSASSAVRATLLKPDGRAVATVFAKLAPLPDVADEARRYREAALRLPAGAYAPLLDTVDAGAGRTGGLFYGLAGRHQASLFEWLEERPEESGAVVEQLREFLEAWRDRDHVEEVLVTTLRRNRVDSTVFMEHSDALGEEWSEFERKTVPVRQSLQHGDLHGENVLVGESAIPLMIDFANVDTLPGCFDPIVLELSLLFHPDSPFVEAGWPSTEQCERWADLEAYLEGCPAADAVRACRDWAHAEAASEATVYAVAYAEAVRQIEFVPKRRELALAVARAAAAAGMRALEGARAPS